MDFLIECVKIGFGIIFIIKDFLFIDLEKGNFIEIFFEKKIFFRYIGIIYKNFISLFIVVKMLIDFLKNEYVINM